MASNAEATKAVTQTVFNYIFSRKGNPILSGLQITFSFDELGRGVLTFWAEKTYRCIDFITGKVLQDELLTINPMQSLLHCSRNGDLSQEPAATLLRVTPRHAIIRPQIHSVENEGTLFGHRNLHFHLGSTLDEDPSTFPITPRQLQCWVSQIIGFQERLEWRRNLANSQTFADKTQWIRDYCKNGEEVLEEIKNEAEYPFISREAVKDLLFKYSEFYKGCYGASSGPSKEACHVTYDLSREYSDEEHYPMRDLSHMSLDVQAISAVILCGLWAFGFSAMLSLLNKGANRLGMEQSQIDSVVNTVYFGVVASVLSLNSVNLALIAAAMFVHCVVNHLNRDNTIAIASSIATLSAGNAILNTVDDNKLPAIAIGVTQGVVACVAAYFGRQLTNNKSSAEPKPPMSTPYKLPR